LDTNNGHTGELQGERSKKAGKKELTCPPDGSKVGEEGEETCEEERYDGSPRRRDALRKHRGNALERFGRAPRGKKGGLC